MAIIDFFVGKNSHLVRVRQLADLDSGGTVSDAIVRVEYIRDQQGSDLAGVTWPLIMQADGNGAYLVTIPAAASFIDGAPYDYSITAYAPGGLEAEWQGTETARKRSISSCR